MNCIFCHIRYCDQQVLQEIPLIMDFHYDWFMLNHMTFENNEEKYLNALELLITDN